MELIELANKRCSIRAYESKNIEKEKLEYILECARIAPSAVNKQPWHFYICQSEEAREKVYSTYHREWFRTAPVVIIACINHDEEWIRNDGHAHGIVDISIAVEHICLAATEVGLGSCWVCNFDTQKCKELFELPENQEAAVLIPLGYAATSIPEKNRKNIEEITTIL